MLDRVEGERVGEKEGGEGEKLERRKLWWSLRKGGGENGEGEGKRQLEGVRKIIVFLTKWQFQIETYRKIV